MNNTAWARVPVPHLLCCSAQRFPYSPAADPVLRLCTGSSGARNIKEKDMQSKRRAAFLLLVFTSVLILMAGWNYPEEQERRNDQ